jgi:acyl-CoA synthetase (AMP-forming)/AMP-acid ligase II
MIIDKNLGEMLYRQAISQPNKTAIEVVSDNGIKSINYMELYQKALALSTQLLNKLEPHSRVIILYPTSIEYIIAFLACSISGMVAVPCYPPINSKFKTKVTEIIKDCRPKLILAHPDIASSLKKCLFFYPFLKILQSFNIKMVSDKDFLMLSSMHFNYISSVKDSVIKSTGLLLPPNIVEPNDLAFLQYTSGTTGASKGVMVSHENILNNAEMINYFFKSTVDTKCFSWLPPYHDMGLIGTILYPLYIGFTVRLISPMDFLRSPIRWLKEISDMKATVSGGPSFSYAMCLKINTDDLDVDLSSWSDAFCGAEKIRNEVLSSFVKKFAPYGFRSDSFSPCYGLAEGTLMVSGKYRSSHDDYCRVDKKELLENKIVKVINNVDESLTFASCGNYDYSQQKLCIVDQYSNKVLPDKKVGKICISSPCVARGYWEKENKTSLVFGLEIDGKKFLDTGDLGFTIDNQLYVVGRLKDTIIIHGVNYFSESMEILLDENISDVLPGGVCVIQVEEFDVDTVTVVIESKNNDKEYLKNLGLRVCSLIYKEYSLSVRCVYFVDKKFIPRTTSGKVSRYQLAGEIDLDEKSYFTYTQDHIADVKALMKKNRSKSVSEDNVWELITKLAQRQGKKTISKSLKVTDVFPESLSQMNLLTNIEVLTQADEISFDLFAESMTIDELISKVMTLIKDEQSLVVINDYNDESIPPLPMPQLILDKFSKFEFNLTFVCDLKEKIKPLSCKNALMQLLSAQPFLCSYYNKKNKKMGFIEPEKLIDKIFFYEKINKSPQKAKLYIEQLISKYSHKITHYKAPLFFCVLLKNSYTDTMHLVPVFSHIISDPYSIYLFYNQLEFFLIIKDSLSEEQTSHFKQLIQKEYDALKGLFSKSDYLSFSCFQNFSKDRSEIEQKEHNAIKNELIYDYHIDFNKYDEIIQLTQKLECSIDLIIMSVALLALSKQINIGKYIQFMHNGRNILPIKTKLKHLIGWMTFGFPIKIDNNVNSVIEFVKMIINDFNQSIEQAWAYNYQQVRNNLSIDGVPSLLEAKIEYSNFSGLPLETEKLFKESAFFKGSLVHGETFSKKMIRYRDIFIRPMMLEQSFCISFYYEKGKLDARQLKEDLSQILSELEAS